jgi:hypothetical protein
MTQEERDLLVNLGTFAGQASEHLTTLFKDRNDMLVAFTATLLDLYRVLFAAGLDSKDAAAARLRTQRDQLAASMPDAEGTVALEWIAASLETEKLDAAALMRKPTVGTA